MLKKIISIFLILSGLVVLGLGIGSGTIWKPAETVTLKTGSLADALLVVTEPGVVRQINEAVTVKVTAPEGGEVGLVLGRATDIAGWIGTDSHWSVTGANSWDKLDTKLVKGAPAEEPTDKPTDAATEEAEAVSPIAGLLDSDMWLQTLKGEGSVTLDLNKVPDNYLLLAGSLDPKATAAPEVSLTWDREVATPLMLPGILVGALLLAIGLLLLVDSLRRSEHWTDLSEELAGTTDKSPAPLGGADKSVEPDVAAQVDEAEAAAGDEDRAGAASEPDLKTADELFAPSAQESPATVADELDTNESETNESDADGQATDADPDAEASADEPDHSAFTPKDQADEPEVTEAEHTFAPLTLNTDLDEQPGAEDLAEPASEPAASTATEATAGGSWFKKMFAKKQRAEVPRTDLPAARTTDGELMPTIEPERDPITGLTAEESSSQEKALEAFAAMGEPEVTTGALAAAGLTRRQLREMRERQALADAEQNVPSTTGSLELGAERPSWLPQGADTTSGSSWRAKWGIRPEDAEQIAASESSFASAVAEAEEDPQNLAEAPDEPAKPLTTRRALYSSYRAAAERIANETDEEEADK